MMCLSIIRFITDYVKYSIIIIRFLPLNVIHHLIVDNDVFMLLIPLIESKPWLRENSSGDREVFEQNKWITLNKADYSKLPKQEA